jgi:hypothetical protein
MTGEEPIEPLTSEDLIRRSLAPPPPERGSYADRFLDGQEGQ